MNSGESDDKDLSEETQYNENEEDDFEDHIVLKLDTQTSDLAESVEQNISQSDEGLFTAPLSRASFQTPNTSADDKLFVTASQQTINLSSDDDTFPKLEQLSDTNISPDFQQSSDPTVLTPLSDEGKPGSQDLFHLTSSGNQMMSSQRFDTFSSSTPRVRESSSDDSPASKRPKLEEDGDSSVETIPKESNNSNSVVLKSDTSMETQPFKPSSTATQVRNEDKTGNPSPDKLVSQSSAASTIPMDSLNKWTGPPPTTEDFTLHYTQSASQVNELTDMDASRQSNGISTVLNRGFHKSPGSNSTPATWGSHNYDDSYDSHSNSHIKSKITKPESKIFEETTARVPATVLLKLLTHPETKKLAFVDILEVNFNDDATKELFRLSFSSCSSGVLGDVSSGGSSLYSQPGPFSLRQRTGPNPNDFSSPENSDPIKREPSKRLVNGNKVLRNDKLSPFHIPDKFPPARCSNCKHTFPTSQLFVTPNGTANGSAKGKIRIITPDISSQTDAISGSSSSQENGASSPITYQEITRSLDDPLGIETIVFGFWSNIYFPCRIIKIIDDKYTVSFLDTGAEKTYTKNKLIPLSVLVPTSALKVQIPNLRSGQYGIGQLEAISDSNHSAPFAIKVGEEIKYFPIESLAITEHQRKSLLKNDTRPPAANLSSIDLENCTDGKRNRTPRQTSIIPTLSSPRTGKSARKLFKNTTEPKATTSDGKSPRGNRKSAACKKIDESKSYSTDSDFEYKQYKLDLSGNGIRGVHLEKKDFDDPLSGLKQKNITSENDDDELKEKYGPIPARGSNLFSGLVFVLTCTDEYLNKSSIQTDSMSSGTDEPDYYEHPSYPFSKSRLITQIKAGGGVYYENITDVPFNELKNTILIANKPSLTCTYIYAVAEGIRKYLHSDLIHCCVDNLSFKEYMDVHSYLPNGWSYTQGYDHPGESKKKKSNDGSLRPQLFKNEWILLLLDEKSKDECIYFWTAILEIAGATVKRGYAKVTDKSPVIAITDESCPQDILSKKDVNCVSVVWLIQCLINNSKLKVEKHPHFKYNFKPGPSDDSV